MNCAPHGLDNYCIMIEMDFNTWLTLFSAVLLAGFLVFFAFFLWFQHQKRLVYKIYRAFFHAPDEKTPSQFALMVDYAGHLITNRALKQIQTSVAGMNSVESKAENQEKINAIMGSTPTLAGLSGLLPKKWLKNAAFLQMVAQFLGHGKSGNGQGEPEEAQSVFKF